MRRWLAIGAVVQALHCGALAAPQRIVSLLPSLTETVCVLGACDRLVGVDRYSNWPTSVRQLPKMGGGLDPNVEAIVAAKPDLVLVAKSSRVLPRLRALGLHLEVLEPQTHAEMDAAQLRIARLLAVPDSEVERIQQSSNALLAAARDALPAQALDWRVYIEVSDGPYAAAPASFIGETLARLGLANVVADGQGPFPRVSTEWVVAQQPDLIIVGSMGATQLDKRPGWNHLRAVQQQQVCAMSPEQADVLVRAGPRWAEAAQLITQCAMRAANGA